MRDTENVSPSDTVVENREIAPSLHNFVSAILQLATVVCQRAALYN